MAETQYSKAGLPEAILGISCQAHRAWMISYVLSYYKVDARKRASKVELLTALRFLAPTVPKPEQQAIIGWFQSQNSTLAGLASSITAARNAAANGPTGDIVHDPQGMKCSVCLETLTSGSFPKNKTTSQCDHEPSSCNDCVRKYLETRINEHPWSKIRCLECKEIFSESEVKNWASTRAFKIYQRNSRISAIHHLPNFISCLAPDCGYGQIHEFGDEQSIMICEVCGFKTCPRHKVPYHVGQTCEEYDAARQHQIKEEAKTEKYLAENTKVCPGPGCGIHTVKDGRACDHITCLQCRFHYCWACLVPYDLVRRIGGTAHKIHCHMWADETPDQYNARRSEERRNARGPVPVAPLKRKRDTKEGQVRGEGKRIKTGN